MKLKDLSKGDYFTLKDIQEPLSQQVYVKGSYDRTSKTYSCFKFEDMNQERFFKADKTVFTDFTF